MRSLVRMAVQFARQRGVEPRVHPNGFIQLDLVEDDTRIAKQRLHVWPDGDDIPCQKTVTTIHDHRFNMRSTILSGQLIQQPYGVLLDPGAFSHEIFTARYPDGRKESQLMGTGVKVLVGKRDYQVLGTGQSYTQHRYVFHDTDWSGLTATLMEKSREDLDHEPRVLVPLGEQPDNSFVRAKADKDLLWAYIDRALSDNA